MWVSHYFICFILYSVLGYLYETTYCTIKERQWQNRGFLFGPICPIYGVGAVLAASVFRCKLFFPDGSYSWWQVFVICMAGSAVLEYVTSWLLEKLFHAYWWDYSDMPLNLHGRISLFSSIAFGVGGVLIVCYLDPLVNRLVFLAPEICKEVLAMLFMALFAADLSITVVSLTNMQEQLSGLEQRFDDRMAQFVDKTVEKIGDNLETAKDLTVAQYMEGLISHMPRVQLTALRRVAGFHLGRYKDALSQKLPEFIKKHKNR